MDVTLLELNVDGLRLSLGGPDDGLALGVDGEETTDDAGGGRPWLAALVGLLFLAVLAVLARRRLDDEEA